MRRLVAYLGAASVATIALAGCSTEGAERRAEIKAACVEVSEAFSEFLDSNTSLSVIDDPTGTRLRLDAIQSVVRQHSGLFPRTYSALNDFVDAYPSDMLTATELELARFEAAARGLIASDDEHVEVCGP